MLKHNFQLNKSPHNLIILVGPTASGKSELAVKLAKKFNGEIISFDSRQIYKGLDLGTGKISGHWKKNSYNTFKRPSKMVVTYVYKNISHYCIDYVNPSRQYSVAKFKKDAQKAILDISQRNKLPILCGGTGYWIDAVVYNQELPEIKPNPKLRLELQKKSTEQLFKQLEKLDPVRASTIDPKNPHRLIRALEIVITTGKPVPTLNTNTNEQKSIYNPIWLGIKTNQEELYSKIDKRLKQRLKQGMIEEVKQLQASGLSWKKLENFGLEYKYIALFLQNKISYQEMVEQLSYAIKHYSKRQLTWWKRNNQIKWLKPEIKELVKALK